MIGHGELWIIVLVAFVLFGASALPKFARSLGRAKKEFEKGIKEEPKEETAEEREQDGKGKA